MPQVASQAKAGRCAQWGAGSWGGGGGAPEARALMAAAPEEVVKALRRKPREMPRGVAKEKVAMTAQNWRGPASESTMLLPSAYAARPLCACTPAAPPPSIRRHSSRRHTIACSASSTHLHFVHSVSGLWCDVM